MNETGIEQGLTFPAYQAIDALNPSMLKVGVKSMKHMRYAMDHKQASTDAFTLGNACHTMVFEPHELDNSFLVFDGRKDKRTAEYKAVLEEAEETGKLIIKTKELGVAAAMGLAVAKDPMVAPLIKAGKAEVSLTSMEEGLPVKGRLDWVMEKPGFCDLKTCADITAPVFGAAFFKYGYDVSLGLYQRWLSRLRGQKEPCYILCVEKSPPYDVAVIEVDDMVLELGAAKGLRVIKEYKKCLTTGVWPGIARGAAYWLHVPNWAMEEPETDWS